MRLVLAFILVLSGLVQAVTISPSELKRAGIFGEGFRMVSFTDDGALVGLEKTRQGDQQRGLTYKLWTLRFDEAGSLEGSHFVPLTVPKVEQIALTPDQSRVVVVTHAGLTFLTVDLATGALATITTDVTGEESFRTQPPMLLTHGDLIYTLGRRYDERGPVGPLALATVDLSRRGIDAFSLGPDIGLIQKEAGKVALANWTAPDQGFLAVNGEAGQSMVYWRAGQPLKVLDTAQSYTSLWGAGDRAVTTALSAGGQNQALLLDASAGTRQVLGEGPRAFGYPHLSEDGSTAVVCHLDVERSQMSVFSARATESYTLRPVPELQDVTLGALRLAPDGSRLAHFSGEGLRVVKLP